jgi:hypothetical protein
MGGMEMMPTGEVEWDRARCRACADFGFGLVWLKVDGKKKEVNESDEQ